MNLNQMGYKNRKFLQKHKLRYVKHFSLRKAGLWLEKLKNGLHDEQLGRARREHRNCLFVWRIGVMTQYI